jgi:uncharacterized membrane protein YhhN
MMTYAKAYLLFGALIILGSTAAFDWATLSENVDAPQVPPIALFVGMLGVSVWLAGCTLISIRIPPGALFGVGGLMLLFLPITLWILNHINPVLFDVHIDSGGMLAPVTAGLESGLIFLVVGLIRLAPK